MAFKQKTETTSRYERKYDIALDRQALRQFERDLEAFEGSISDKFQAYCEGFLFIRVFTRKVGKHEIKDYVVNIEKVESYTDAREKFSALKMLIDARTVAARATVESL
jgi:hypothetical protein